MMSDILIMKLIIPPMSIGLVSLAGRRWGPVVGGWLVGLPLTSGPVVFFLALEQGNVFAAKASLGIITGIVSLNIFCLAYSWLSVWASWLISMLIGWCAYLVIVFFLNMISAPLVLSFIGVTFFIALSYTALPKIEARGVRPNPPLWEIPVRMVVTTLLVIILTGTARMMGPQLSGLLIPFPVYASVLAVFTHKFQGASAAIHLLRGVVAGSLTFAVFFLIVAGLIENWGIAASFALASLIASLVHGAAFWILIKK